MTSEIRGHVCCPHSSHTTNSRITESLLFLTYMLSPAYYFIFTLLCIVRDFFLNNQPDAPIIQIYSVIKRYCFGHLLCPASGVFYCTFGTGKLHVGFWWPFPSRVRMEPIIQIYYVIKVYMSGRNRVSSWLCLETVIKNLHETYQCRMHSRKLLMMGKEDARKHVEFYNRINLDNWCVWLVIQKELQHITCIPQNNWSMT